MSKKNLLQESDIRRMMKFANIGALSDTFVEKLNEGSYYNEEEADEEESEESDESDEEAEELDEEEEEEEEEEE